MKKEEKSPESEAIEKEVAELEKFFASATIPDEIRLSDCESIINPKRFLEAHIQTVRMQKHNPRFAPYLQRLIRVKEILSAEAVKPKKIKTV